jgi:hypothetical protein
MIADNDDDMILSSDDDYASVEELFRIVEQVLLGCESLGPFWTC